MPPSEANYGLSFLVSVGLSFVVSGLSFGGGGGRIGVLSFVVSVLSFVVSVLSFVVSGSLTSGLVSRCVAGGVGGAFPVSRFVEDVVGLLHPMANRPAIN